MDPEGAGGPENHSFYRLTFSKFYIRYYDLISKFQVGLKSLLRQGLSETVSLSLSHWHPGSGVVLDCIDS